MPKFHITEAETWHQTYEVEADNLVEAIKKRNSGEGSAVEGSLVFAGTNTEVGMVDDQFSEEDWESLQDANLTDDTFLPGIVDVGEA